jgi:hypothetical protein
MASMAEKLTETRDEALHRLAAEATKKGVCIYVYARTGEHYASSASHPGELHRVMLVSCDCAGFLRHQSCIHYAALLAELGELPKEPACTSCDGAGAIPYPVRITSAGTTVYGSYPCGLCQVAEPVDAWKWAS